MIIESRAYARAGLLGNPSDGYFGKTISISVRNFGAHVILYQTPELRIELQAEDQNIFRNIYHLSDYVSLMGYYGGTRLVKAAIRQFAIYCEENDIKLPNQNFTLRYHSSIPRQVGLAGSSAIITATMRALMAFYEVEIPQEILPNIVLASEKDELGINAGLQDRVAQVYEGCVYMDFNKQQMTSEGFGLYERLKPSTLPNLYIAYKTDLTKESGVVLNDIRTRYEKGDPFVIDILAQIADKAAQGREALIHRDLKALNSLVNENFDLRRKIMNITESNIEMVETARDCGASAKFAGSGGSIIGLYQDDDMLNRLIVAMRRIRARVIKPYVI
jgi:glucuronokinase